MTTELQEKFKNYVFEDVKTNIDEWFSMVYYRYRDAETKRKFRDKIIELRRLFAKENSLKTVTPLCPKPSDLEYPVMKLKTEYVNSERARMWEEYSL